MIDAAIMLGGGKKIKSILKGSKDVNSVAIIVMLVLFFI